ncbi:MAG: T9SS type A sorting domain-containing protein [Bacteroidia bacterium]
MAKLYHLKVTISLCFLFILSNSNSQVIILGNGSFNGSNFAGPINSSTSAGASSRYAYIFPENTVSSLRHNDTITSISFLRNGGDSIIGNANMKIFMRTTVNSDYGIGNINWVGLTGTTGMTKVYDKNPQDEIDSLQGWVRFLFSTPYVVDTVLGKNLEILVEYIQTSAQSSNIFWTFENSGSVFGYGNNQTKFTRTNGGTLTDTTNVSSELHPTIRIEFPRHDFDISVGKVYSLGKLPVPSGNVDSVKAIIQNVGKKDANFKMYLKSAGSNNLIDSANYSLKYLEEKTLSLPSLFPNNTGLDTLLVFAQNDSNSSNNSSSVIRLATGYVYSYKDPTLPIAGGIGFNGNTGDFVAKFHSNQPKNINQITVNFALSNQKFQLGIWKSDGPGGKPGTNIWTSDTLTSAPTFISPVLPPVQIDSNFYVGVRQLGTQNVAFGYQAESPVRSNTFYYAAPLGDSSWVDFAPDAPFKFAIEPRIQADFDLSPTVIYTPLDTIKLSNVSTIAPKAKVINYGAKDITSPYTIKFNIFRYGYLEYTSSYVSSITDTFYSGDSKIITFDSSFLPKLAGDYDIQVVSLFPSDQLKDNDTLRSTFIIAAFNDVGPATIFDPSSGYDYEQFVDTIYPTVFIQNYGLDFQGPFNVRAEIYDSTNTLIYTDSRPYSLTALNSVLASFKTFPCDLKGSFKFVAFTQLLTDVNRVNDTVFRFFKIIRSNDVQISSIEYPKNNTSLTPPVSAKKPEAKLENVGDGHIVDNFWSYCEIFYNDSQIYRDSSSLNSFKGIVQTLFFKDFQPIQKGYYRMRVYSSVPEDQYRANDTLYSDFSVGVPDDIEVVSISPPVNSGLQLDSVYESSVTLRNNGYEPQSNPFTLVFKVTKGTSINYIRIRNLTLDSNETKTFILDTSLQLYSPEVHDVQVYTVLAKDFVKSNDTIQGVYYGKKNYDIGVAKILYPGSGDTILTNIQTINGLVQVVNYGDSLTTDRFSTILNIYTKPTNVLLYSKTIDSNFMTKDTLILEYPSFGVNGASFDVRLESYTKWSKDQFITNDTAGGETKFLLLYDLVADSIIVPQNGKTYVNTSGPILPQVQLNNKSLVTLEDFDCKVLIALVDTQTLAETIIYRDSVIVQGLSASEIRSFNMLNNFPILDLDKGVYKAYLFTDYKSDQVPSNNSISINFRIEKETSIQDIINHSIRVYPVPSSHIINVHFENNVKLPKTIEVFDAQGKNVLSINVSNYDTQIDVSKLANGVYTLDTGKELINIIVEK